ncbi:N-acyl homoserine lactonase [Geothermobacter hydrogeniphilus]|uniref:N-acyl homoserine lactonase n=1 Tax=Geothermobacter hydrogeniphilus TaxID=1969733 RepID=A0A2K2H6V0_9BACT|nr:NAD(+)--dinitrogen-reductase ADP-D-ribosyltransferase [Geothermobacter hydrogeniphilus]PNU18953.1 N-acyl homoserine lactonase [Geothermobacter hydrogeniphilus]
MNDHLINHCNLPPRVIASRHFNTNPQTLKIQGVCAANRLLFELLRKQQTAEERGIQFHDYMDVKFQLHQWQREDSKNSRKSLKNSYLRFLRGWLFDSNSIEGAVLKGWVESRFGLVPTFHHQPIRSFEDEAYQRFAFDRMKGAERTSAIFSQLDLLYEFVQQELPHHYPGRTHLRLYRGINDLEEHLILEQYGRKRYLLRLNNLNSFTDDFEHAWEFGSRVLQTEVPLVKVVFAGGLLPRSLFRGEGELLAIGGEYEVEALTGG